MWLFLAQEVMFFGGLFASTRLPNLYPAAFAAGSAHLNWKLGAFNTAVLIGSSLTMAMAVHAAAVGARRQIVAYLLATVALGTTFLGVKVVEYADKFHHHLVPGATPFEGPGPARPDLLRALLRDDRLHALHMIIGIPILPTLAWLALAATTGPTTTRRGDDRAVLALRTSSDLPVPLLYLIPMQRPTEEGFRLACPLTWSQYGRTC
jgi:cytochrome c oxidase subunit 3